MIPIGCSSLGVPAGARSRRLRSKNVIAVTSPNSRPIPGRSDAARFAAEDILTVLDRHQVDYVVIGAFVVIAWGAPLEANPRRGRDTTREIENLCRLAEDEIEGPPG